MTTINIYDSQYINNNNFIDDISELLKIYEKKYNQISGKIVDKSYDICKSKFIILSRLKDNKILGFCTLLVNTMRNIDKMELLNLYVHKNYLRRGYDSEIVKYAFDWGYTNGISEVIAYCDDNDNTFYSLYRKLGGFQKIIGFDINKYNSSIMMIKYLK